MKKTFNAFCFLCVGLIFAALQPAQSQTAKVAWGPVLKEPKNSFTSKIIGNDKNGFYTLRSNPSDKAMFLERYDKKNNLEFSKELVLPLPENVKAKNMRFEDIYYLNGQLVMFSSYLNDKAGKNFAFANKVSSDGVVDKRMMEVGVVEGATKNRPGEFNFVLSNDSTKILVFKIIETKPNEHQKMEYKVLDNNLNVAATKAMSLPDLTKNIEIINYTVDNDANVYVMVANFLAKEDRNSKEQTYNYKVLGYFTDGTNKEYEIKIPGKFVTNITFNIDKDKNLVLAGFYGETWKSGPGSVFFLKTDFHTRKVIAQGTKKLSPEVLELFMSKNKAAKDDSGIRGLKLRKLIVREDGGALMVAEQAWVDVTRHRSGNITYTTYHYHNNEILFVSIQPTGNIDWITCIPKQQHTKDDGGVYNSYSLSVNGDKIFLIYNDHVDNIQITDPRKLDTMKNPGKAVTMLVTLDSNGKFKRNVLFPAKEAKTIVRPTYYLQGSDSVIIYSETGRDYRFGNIRFN